MHILIIEDETKVANALRAGLEAEHYEVTIAATGEEGFFLASQGSFDLLLLDLMLPRRDGIDVLATLRKRGIQTPVFVLTAKDAVEDRVIGLDQGADDYLTKPFAFSELLARIRALLRRGRMDQILKLQHEDLEMDLVTRKVSRGAQSLDLTAKEFDMLEYLLRHRRQRRVAGDARARCVARDGTGHAPRQCHRRHHRAPAPQDRRTVRKEAAAHGPRRRIHAGRGTGMRIRPPSVRARLTLWHAGVLTLIVCIFSAGILHFVEERLYAGLDTQLERQIATIGRIYREEPDELKDLASHWGITLFQVDEGGSIRYQTEAWEREGLARALQTDDSASAVVLDGAERTSLSRSEGFWILLSRGRRDRGNLRAGHALDAGGHPRDGNSLRCRPGDRGRLLPCRPRTRSGRGHGRQGAGDYRGVARRTASGRQRR